MEITVKVVNAGTTATGRKWYQIEKPGTTFYQTAFVSLVKEAKIGDKLQITAAEDKMINWSN